MHLVHTDLWASWRQYVFQAEITAIEHCAKEIIKRRKFISSTVTARRLLKLGIPVSAGLPKSRELVGQPYQGINKAIKVTKLSMNQPV